MFLSCGIDIVSVRRIEEILDRYGDRFLKKVFPEGVEYCYKKRKGEFAGCIAARFALKEAVIKALSSIGKEVGFTDITITGGGKNLIINIKNCKELKFIYSISHEKEFAIAIVNILNRKAP
jgi:holo-[acyl-carrier protein] synthase